MDETEYLLSSTNNAERLLESINQIKQKVGNNMNNNQFNVNEINTRQISRKWLLEMLNEKEQKMYKSFVKSVVVWLMIKSKMNNYVWFQPTRLELHAYNMYWLDKRFYRKLEWHCHDYK